MITLGEDSAVMCRLEDELGGMWSPSVHLCELNNSWFSGEWKMDGERSEQSTVIGGNRFYETYGKF